MAKIIGRHIEVGVGKETVRGTAVAPTFGVAKATCTIDDNVDVLINENSVGRVEDGYDGRAIKQWGEGEITGLLYDKHFGLYLLSLFGTVSSVAKSAPNTAVYDHTFTINNVTQPQSLTLDVKNGSNEHLAFALAQVDSLEIKAEVGKFVEIAVGFKSKAGVASTQTITYTTEYPFTSKHVVLKMASTAAGLGAASAIPASSVTVKFNRNVEPEFVFGSTSVNDVLAKQFSCEISATFVMDNATYKGYFSAGTMMACLVDIINSDVTIGTSSNPELKITMTQVAFDKFERNGANDEIVTQTISGKATYKVSETKMVDVVLTNLTTSY